MALRKKKFKIVMDDLLIKKEILLKLYIKGTLFELTKSQINVLKDIRSDLSNNKNMNRLLQGDVGCGKQSSQ